MSNKIALESGTYEIIRNRLQEQSRVLTERLHLLNEGRKSIFNTEQFALIANQRITTQHNGVARGIIALDDLCIFAYNVHFGLREEIDLQDVFSIYQFVDNHFEPASLELIEDEQFIVDFKNLYKYYREAFFSKFYRTQNYIYMLFQTSKDVTDRKAFKWYIDGQKLVYIDDRSVHEVVAAPQYSFEFVPTTLEDRRLGTHPHISIQDKVFIEAIGGDLTFKVEDNTSTGLGIYSEPVLNKDQQLDDAKFFYADLGNLIAIKVIPYQESARAFIFNVRTKEVTSIPSLLDSGILLPDDQGIIFANGYYLQNGTYKLFPTELHDLEYMRTIAAPNGEDYLYIFYQKASNTYVLLSYNVIQQEVNTPIICNGFTIFNTGKLIYFKSETEAIRHHNVQIWQTPYAEKIFENEGMRDEILYKIGNKDIVAVMAEANEIVQLTRKEDTYEGLYEDISRKARQIVDSYFWLGEREAASIADPLIEIGQIADTAIDEFAKVQAQMKLAQEQFSVKEQDMEDLSLQLRNARFETVDQLLGQLSTVRLMQGSILALKEIRYMDLNRVDSMIAQLKEFNESLSHQTVEFLLQENALQPYRTKIEEQSQLIAAFTKVVDGQLVEQSIVEIATQLELLIDILNSLKIEDTTQVTIIIEQVSVLFASLNEVKALLSNKTSELRSRESIGEFHAQMTLLDQSIVNFLDLSETIEKCDSYQTKLSIHIEELESKFADFEEFVSNIADKRDEILIAFQSKKETLIQQQNRRSGNLEQIGKRILRSIENKAESLKSNEEILSFFAGDLMIEKLRTLSEELFQLGEVGKAEGLTNDLKMAQEQALRKLHDRNELFVDGRNVISLGEYKFAVNTHKLALTITERDKDLYFHLMGTNFYQKIEDEQIGAYRTIWGQEYATENQDVYRSSYLAYQLFQCYLRDSSIDPNLEVTTLLEQNYSGGYVKGVHNHDSLLIFQQLKHTHEQLGLLRYSPEIRSNALQLWFSFTDQERESIIVKAQNAHQVHQLFHRDLQQSSAYTSIYDILGQSIASDRELHQTSMYLLEELKQGGCFIASHVSSKLKASFFEYLVSQQQLFVFETTVLKADWSTTERWSTIFDWMSAFNSIQELPLEDAYVQEATTMVLFQNYTNFEVHEDVSSFKVEQLKGSHPSISQGTLSLHYHVFIKQLEEFSQHSVPQYNAFQQLKRTIVAQYEKRLKLAELQAKPLSSFMRNKLINDVYFPMIGSNLSKQIGTIGSDKNTARMGLLLLISPPGYGKTTLMEYLAATMGLHFVKINGPTIGHRIYSIDPNEAKTSGARAELEKLNLAFEMEDNVMLYIDDIQHCSAEFLQQFISLSDGQRKIDGIFNGESKTYDLRGKRFCIVMAGNPYTESGTKFKIPDMLANRADVYNLGDVVGASRPLFELSLLENAIHSNSYLQRIASKSMVDLHALFNYHIYGELTMPTLESNHSSSEVSDALAVISNLLRVREVILKVNDLYIQSAGMQDQYRVEPAFKLQGSYRNMNKMASKVVPLMNDKELEELILTHYESEAQTLIADAEANILKLKIFMNVASTQELDRYQHIVETFQKNNQFAGMDASDVASQILVQLAGMNEQFRKLVEGK